MDPNFIINVTEFWHDFIIIASYNCYPLIVCFNISYYKLCDIKPNFNYDFIVYFAVIKIAISRLRANIFEFAYSI